MPRNDDWVIYQFKTNEEALAFYTKEYEALGGDQLWEEAECSILTTSKHRKIMSVRRKIQMCKYLIGIGYE